MAAELGDHWTAQYAYSDDWYGLGDASHTAAVTWRYALPADLSVACTGGYTQIGGWLVDDYGYVDAGLAWPRGPFTARLGYTATDDGADVFRDAANGRWSVAVLWRHSLR